ncbi:hypothetical protein HER10_EVM0002654 [Colletotrichum scovillei]|uniref:Uncharacterized protein n=1 Tax=Colletotrichum scovillei TaxID=1209932 RepID=A0A9P7QWN7_9PEZI|nr:uncharacterized protein HER10_EVM0002654 [Colletotrichum scovillei]KAF4774712.1 hypothetical protein HER10_EVM0002654 [Colletotrichum scovillei]KAG7042819.1 hypothetical protein JMJ78_0006326 [Colletotrichum scovillei]KAG7043411.1 hypothetical protein JMJ77_0003117 [Colletotrichum scovillei]KAG7062863.1 hypothetical protein JMJ76_0009706 [Colletotrichum scovillei]
MVLHRQQAQFDRSRWRMALLVPLWILQLLVFLVVIALFSWRLSDTLRNWETEEETKGMFPMVEVVWESVNIAFSLVCLFSTFYEISKLAAETLTPWTMLFTHILKIVCSLAVLALDVVVFVQRKDSHYSVVGLGLDCFLLILVAIPGVYAIQTYRRLVKYDDYHYPVNHKPYGFNDLEGETSYNGRLSIGGLSLADRSLRRISTSSTKSSIQKQETQQTAQQQQQQQECEATSLQRRPSQYNNERDTQFDRYMVERAMNNEFGWANNSSPGADPLGRSDSYVGSGSMSNGKVVTRESMGRAPSWGSSHVLVAVPEMDEEEAIHGRGGDRQALLGHRRQDSDDSVAGPSSPPILSAMPPPPRIEIEESDIVGGGAEENTWERKRKRSQ